jgi:hypothetical protein
MLINRNQRQNNPFDSLRLLCASAPPRGENFHRSMSFNYLVFVRPDRYSLHRQGGSTEQKQLAKIKLASSSWLILKEA